MVCEASDACVGCSVCVHKVRDWGVCVGECACR